MFIRFTLTLAALAALAATVCLMLSYFDVLVK